jgi:hypothetical protein
MEKLNLSLDDLAVDSFHTGNDAMNDPGTVRGNIELSPEPPCIIEGTGPNYWSCFDTCGLSCNGTCVEPTCGDCDLTNQQDCGGVTSLLDPCSPSGDDQRICAL